MTELQLKPENKLFCLFPPPPPPFYLKRFEYPEKRYISASNYYNYKVERVKLENAI